MHPSNLLSIFYHPELLQGLAVARNAVIVAEAYFTNTGPEPDPVLHVMSVTKSITTTLVGIAIEKGFIQSVNQTISDFLNAEVDSVNAALGQVTIHQLLTMTSGQDWHELTGASEFGDFVSAPHQIEYVINKPVINTPGTVFIYSDGTAHLVSVIVSKATGMNVSAFANQYLFGPMGLGERTWYRDKQGYAYGGVGLCIGIHDMVQIGMLYLNEGVYTGTRIVSAEWIQTATILSVPTAMAASSSLSSKI